MFSRGLSTSSDSPSVKCCHRFGEYSAIMSPRWRRYNFTRAGSRARRPADPRVVWADQTIDQAVVDLDGFGRVGAQRSQFLAVGGIVVERVLEFGLAQLRLDGSVSVDGITENHCPAPAAEILSSYAEPIRATSSLAVGHLCRPRRANGIQVLAC